MMTINQEIFRTYDIRGVAETDLTDEVVEHIGRAYGTLLPDAARTIALSMDCRTSSLRIKQAFERGVCATGKDVIDYGEIPTPLLYFAVHRNDLDGGIQITGSHNPKQYNGMKLLVGKETIFGDDIKNLSALIAAGNYRTGKGNSHSGEILSDYLQYILQRVNIGGKRLRIVFDSGNGTSGPVVRRLFTRIPCTFDILYEEPDGTFPNHLADPTVPEFLSDLIRAVKSTGADIGIGFDGDSDRIGAIDETGRIIWGDKLLAIFAKGVLQRSPGAKIICEVKCSNGLLEYVKGHGGTPLMWKTGHSLIKAKMKEEGAPLAGEMSGHMFFADNYFGFDDAIFAALRLVEILSNTASPLSALADEIPSYFSTPEIRIACPDSEKFTLVQQVKEEFKKTHPVIDIDGVRVNFPDGWGLLRASNTQPVLVLRFEANTAQSLRSVAEEFRQILSSYDFIDIDQLKLPSGTP
jgi:phosphomannomutase/phosphoglucomutase